VGRAIAMSRRTKNFRRKWIRWRKSLRSCKTNQSSKTTRSCLPSKTDLLLTSMFLHIGWLHLIGNMWFLWLAGFILEDRWGRVIYPIF